MVSENGIGLSAAPIGKSGSTSRVYERLKRQACEVGTYRFLKAKNKLKNMKKQTNPRRHLCRLVQAPPLLRRLGLDRLNDSFTSWLPHLTTDQFYKCQETCIFIWQLLSKRRKEELKRRRRKTKASKLCFFLAVGSEVWLSGTLHGVLLAPSHPMVTMRVLFVGWGARREFGTGIVTVVRGRKCNDGQPCEMMVGSKEIEEYHAWGGNRK